jgi:diguanylate cyclase
MSGYAIDLLYGAVTALLGAASAWGLCWLFFRHNDNRQGRIRARNATEVLIRLRDLATRVAVDVEEHTSQVEQINGKLTLTQGRQPESILEAVTKLIEANRQVQERLTSTENKLREQAQQIQINAVEARTDPLTLLANRRALDDELERRLAELRRQGRIFSLLMADLDRFKGVNDAYGHPVGDQVLREVAATLRRKMRDMDLVARYGGEEFAMILPGTCGADACKAAERIRVAIEAARFHHRGEALRITVSLGVAEARAEENAAAVILRADKALYAAKAGGRNAVYWHDGENIRPAVAEQPAAAAVPPAEPAQPTPAKADSPRIRPAAAADRWSQTALADCLTLGDLPTRTIFCQQVRNRMAEWKRGGPTFSILLVELNQYAQDGQPRPEGGHEISMASVARFLTGNVREMDVLGHYAPGCFALLLPTARLAQTIQIAQRLREEFAQIHGPMQVPQSRLTLSIAAVQVMDNDDTISLLKRAEAALDAAGRHGGDAAFYDDGDRCLPITAMPETLACRS